MRSFLIFVITAFFLGCNTEKKETTTSGNLNVFIPESIAPVMIDEVKAFLSLYQQNGAQITYTIVTSQSAVRHFVQDTSRIAFLTCKLAPAEKEMVKKVSPDFNEIIIAYDGIVVIVNSKNKIAQMTTTEIQKILTGKITKWNQLANSKSMKGNIKIYCQDSSDVTMYLTGRLVKQNGISANFVRTTSDIETIKSVEKEPYSLGFASLSWIDSAKSTAKVLELGRTNEDTDTTFTSPEEAKGEFFSPHPANILRDYYPLKRAVYMYTRGQVDLAGGFGTYVATAEGQKLLLNRGILPGTQHIKLKKDQPF